MLRRVLITGARAAAALDLAREFAAAGWNVHCADCSPARIARWSSAVQKVHRYAPPAGDPNAFQEDLKRLLEHLKPDLVVPACEEVFHLAAPDLSEAMDGKLFAPPLPLLRKLHDKFAFATACKEWGIDAPESHLLTVPDDLTHFAQKPEDWIFKPPFSRFGESTRLRLNRSEILALQVSSSAPLIAQRRILGDEVCFYGTAHGGKLSAFSSYRSGWRLSGGAGFAFAPLEEALDKTLKAIGQSLAQAVNITGQFACDVIIDKDNTPWLIECNPRATSGVHMLAKDGELARAIADGVAVPELEPQYSYLAPAMFVFGLPLALRTGRVAQWRSTMRNGHDAISRRGDRLPLLGAMADAAGFALRGMKHGISTTAATTRDIEWNGEELL